VETAFDWKNFAMNEIDFPGCEAPPLAPVAAWPVQENFEHVVQFYSEDAALVKSLGQFIGGALAAGDAAIVIATSVHGEGLNQQLLEQGLDVAGAMRRQQYILLDADETLSKFMRDGLADEAAFSEVVGNVFDQVATFTRNGCPPRVAAFGEMVARLWAQGNSQAALRLVPPATFEQQSSASLPFQTKFTQLASVQ